ncbi:MAG: GNAT family N-acetyltransferase [Planctomycetota bacterium]|jgi:ribosomal protein S18 acetylase RimI-like enzyme
MLTLRAYDQDDWPDVCRVHDRARPLELARGGVDARAFRPMEEAAGDDEFFVSETIVACLDDAVVGFVSWNGDYITWLYVDPDHHRAGIGRRLVRAALERIGPQAWTSTLGGNDAAIGLFREAGMELVRARPGDCDGYPCTALRLALPTSRMRDPAARRADAG